MSEADETRVMPCLGRPFYLGMLYDCRTDNLVPGVTLWDEQTIDQALDRRHKWTNLFSIITEDTVHNKASSLNVEAGLSLSALGGLIEVSGSAKYMTEDRTSSRQARVTMHYSMTSEFKQLTMGALATKNIQHSDIIDKDVATHVVTGVEFGVQAFFVFDHQCSTSENVEDISGKMDILIKKIPSIVIEGNGSMNLNNEEKATADNLQCTFIGDVHLEHLPVTFEQAVKAYQSLPKLIKGDTKPGEYPTHVVPQKVWLYPLYKLDSKAAKFVREISNTFVTQVENVLEDLQEAEMKAGALQLKKVCQCFLGIKQQLEKFAQLVSIHKADILKEIVAVLPAIRGGKESEKKLVAVITEHNKSAFSSFKLSSWLQDKAQEIDILEAYMDPLSNCKEIKLAFTPGELDKEILGQDVDNVLCLMFTVPQNNDPKETLKHMAKEYGMPNQDNSKSLYWYLDRDIIAHMRSRTKGFIELAELADTEVIKELAEVTDDENFTEPAKAIDTEEQHIKFVISQKKPKSLEECGAEILFYRDGKFIDFKEPGKPATPIATCTTHNSIRLWLKHSAPYFSKILYKAESTSKWKAEPVNADSSVTTLSGLKPDTTYYFKMYAAFKLVDTVQESNESGPTLTQKDVIKINVLGGHIGGVYLRTTEKSYGRYIWVNEEDENIKILFKHWSDSNSQRWIFTKGGYEKVRSTAEHAADVPYKCHWPPRYIVWEVMLATDKIWRPLKNLHHD